MIHPKHEAIQYACGELTGDPQPLLQHLAQCELCNKMVLFIRKFTSALREQGRREREQGKTRLSLEALLEKSGFDRETARDILLNHFRDRSEKGKVEEPDDQDHLDIENIRVFDSGASWQTGRIVAIQKNWVRLSLLEKDKKFSVRVEPLTMVSKEIEVTLYGKSASRAVFTRLDTLVMHSPRETLFRTYLRPPSVLQFSTVSQDGVRHVGRLIPYIPRRMVLTESYVKPGTPVGETDVISCDLSPRERAVVQLLVEGKRNKEIAVALGISVRTAESHRANILHKLELRSVAELVRYAVHNKIVEP